MNNSEYQDIIETLERIISMQDQMLERLNGINNTITELNDYISSSTQLTNDNIV